MFHGDSVKAIIKDDDKELYLDIERIHALLDEAKTTNRLLKYFIAPLLIGIQVLLILLVYKG